MNPFPDPLTTLISHLKKLPGVGRKTAERFAFSLLEWDKGDIQKFARHLAELQEKIHPCETCGCLNDGGACSFCNIAKRDPTLLCVVASARDVYAIEETRAFKGVYHVLGSLLSPLEGKTIDQATLNKLTDRLTSTPIEEVVIALDSTLEGDATSLFLKEKIERVGVKSTRLAFGLPMGSSLDYVDYGTLEKAFTGRHTF